MKWFPLVAGVLALVGCEASSFAQRTNAAPLDIYDGFESADLSKLWSRDRFEIGAVEIQTNIVRAGRDAVRITVHSRDKFEAGSPGTSGSERAELLEAGSLYSQEGKAYEYSFSMFFPTNFPVEPLFEQAVAQKDGFLASGKDRL
jgi:hypothetical protein